MRNDNEEKIDNMKLLVDSYAELVNLRNRLSPDAQEDITYEEDHLLLDRVLDAVEEYSKFKQEVGFNDLEEFRRWLAMMRIMSADAFKMFAENNELKKQLESWQQLAANQNAGLTADDLQQILQANTKQVCEKIRKRVHSTWGYIIGKHDGYFDVFERILNQIERGEK